MTSADIELPLPFDHSHVGKVYCSSRFENRANTKRDALASLVLDDLVLEWDLWPFADSPFAFTIRMKRSWNVWSVIRRLELKVGCKQANVIHCRHEWWGWVWQDDSLSFPLFFERAEIELKCVPLDEFRLRNKKLHEEFVHHLFAYYIFCFILFIYLFFFGGGEIKFLKSRFWWMYLF